MQDKKILDHINELIEEEQRLYGHSDLSEADRERLDALQVELDQCWDLLRQRRARREFGDDPDRAAARGADTVEHYSGKNREE